ncbi:MAG: UxaA family hydrolase, partial [Acidobacteriaceae bacterium]|nr:UxaA family hydrolase [Acidobacteriaceae bacterium]
MLYEIENPATTKNSVILLHHRDNVAIARVFLSPGQQIALDDITVLTQSAIPVGHKVAVRRIATGEPVYRYGNVIGFATEMIEPGQHVHMHNLGYKELDPTEVSPVEQLPKRHTEKTPATFLGYQRSDGRIGTRNYIAIVAASNCAAYTSQLIASSFAEEPLPPALDGVVAFPHGEGCGQAIGPDTDQLQRTLEGVLDHPNVSAALILGLGCEV